MHAAPTQYEYESVIEPPEVEPWSIKLADHDWIAATPEVNLAPLGLPSAEERRNEYRVLIDVETNKGHVEMPLPLRVERVGDIGASAYRVMGTQYHLALTFDLQENGGEIHWHLEPGGRDAAGRARILDLLIAMSGEGVLVLRDPEHGALAQLHLDEQAVDQSLHDERRFLTDVLAIEAWSGRRLPLPEDIDDESGALLATVVHWVRQREMRVRFTTNITGLTEAPVDKADELRLHEDVDYQLFGVWVPVGQVNYRVPVTVLRSEPEGGRWRTEFRPPEDWLTATITPPHGDDSVRAVKAVDAGKVPEAQLSPPASDDREQAQRDARELVKEWQLEGPEDEEALDDIRRQWPT